MVLHGAAHVAAVFNDKMALVYVALLGHVVVVEDVLLAQPCEEFVGALP